MVLVVDFLGRVVTWDGQRELQGLGVATAHVIAATAGFQWQHGKSHRPGDGVGDAR